MFIILLKILPVYLIFFIGIILKITHVLKKENADFLLRLAFYFTLPVLVIRSLSEVKINTEIIYLPFISAFVSLLSFLICWFYIKATHVNKSKAGVMFTAIMILNMGFLIPFIHLVYGDHGLSRLLLFDFSNAIIAYTLVYFIAVKHGDQAGTKNRIYKKLLFSPPIWAIIIALILNFTHTQIPVLFNPFLKLAGDMTIPLLLIAVGLYFNPKIVYFKELSATIIMRMGFGLLTGIIISQIFHLDGINKIVVVIGCSAPAGFNTLTFASLENLDKEFAASIVSISLLTSFILVPVLLNLL